MRTRSMVYIALFLAAGVCETGCEPEVEIFGQENIDSYTSIYMPQAEGGAKSMAFNISEEPQPVLFGAAYGGFGYPANDIEVTFTIDPALVGNYNNTNGTDYPILPQEVYSLSEKSVVIPAGKTSSSVIKLMVNTNAMVPFVNHLLPVKIEQVNGSDIKVNEKLRIAYFIITTKPNRADYPTFGRSNWTIVDRSSEEPKEATWGNGGLAIHTIDDNSGTFWHSQWDGNTPPPPHWFIVDMGETSMIHGLSFLGRQSGNDGKPRDVKVEISLNGTVWASAGSFTLLNKNDLQDQFLSAGFNKEARYFKVTVNSAYNAIYTHLAEIQAF